MKSRKPILGSTLLALVLACVAGVSLIAAPHAGAYTIPLPTTTATLAPEPNAAGWNNAPVTVTLTVSYTAATIEGASGDVDLTPPLSRTYYKFGGSGDYSGYTLYDPLNKPVVSAEGPTVVWFYSTALVRTDPADGDSSPTPSETPKSVTVNLDTTAPTTSAALDPLPNAQGVNTSPVTVTLAAADALSGVSATYYRLGAAGDYMPYTAPLAIATEGTTEVFYYSTDKAGNVEAARSVAVTVDLTPPQPKPLSGYGTVQVGRGHWATIVFTVRDPLSSSAQTTLQIRSGGRTIKTIDLGERATNTRLRARFLCNLQAGVYRYRIIATGSSGLSGQYVKGRLAVGSRPTAYIEGAAGVRSGAVVSLHYLLIDPFARSAHLKLQIMEPAKTGQRKTNTVVRSIDLGTRLTNVVGVASFRCTVKPGLYRWAFAAQDGLGINLRTTSNLVWVH